jgi:2-oxoglutarate/2-oxoacid ferredoxin oxidoreductase subunit alpha
MKNELTIKIAGEAGQGIETIGLAACKLFKSAGLNIFAHQDYMSRIRGGNNFFQVRVANKPIWCARKLSNIIIALDKASINLHREEMVANGILMIDRNKYNITDQDQAFFDVPFYNLAIKTGGSELFVNSVALGVLAGIMRIKFSHVEEVLKDIFARKNEEVIIKNMQSAGEGYTFGRDNFKADTFMVEEGELKDQLIMNGIEALGSGAVKAGCKFYSAYPMTPSTAIMNFMAEHAKDFNMIVEQAEDEIAAVNMIIGASFAGVRSMTGTSGGGFCLMVEGLSLAGMTETPIVVVEGQRPGPATGFPTRTEQSDLDFVIGAGHGEFARAVFTPGTQEELFYLTQKAFNLAEKYQIPVLIMTDTYLADIYRNIEPFDLNKIKVERNIISKSDSAGITKYKRYALTDSGISPRAVPSWINDVIYADSDEHTEEGHITEDAAIRNSMVDKRFYRKMSGLIKEIEPPTVYNLDKADIVLVGFGSTCGVMKEVAETIPNRKIGYIHLSQVWPFPAAEVSSLLKGARQVMTVENNAGAQLAKLIRRETGIEITHSILKFDGRPFTFDFIVDYLRKGPETTEAVE